MSNISIDTELSTIATMRLFKKESETTFPINNSALYFQARIDIQKMTCV